jgi:hypothetical protein
LKSLFATEQDKNNKLKLLAADEYSINANYIDFYIPKNKKEEKLAHERAKVQDQQNIKLAYS